MQLIAVSLNARDWFNDNYKLLDYGFNNYKSHLIYGEGQFFKKVRIINGEKEYVNSIAEKSFIYPLKEGEKENIKVSLEIIDNIQAPIEKGTKIGYIYTYINGQLIDKSNLVAKSSINKTTIIDRLLNKLKNI